MIILFLPEALGTKILGGKTTAEGKTWKLI